MDRLQGMRHSRLGNGETECILCGETFRFYHHSQRPCAECGKMACGQCGLEYLVGNPHAQNNQNDNKLQSSTRSTIGGGFSSSLPSSSSVTSLLSSTFIGGILGGGASSGSSADDGKDRVWLCKICGEQRETWKKSGAWFFKVVKFLHIILGI